MQASTGCAVLCSVRCSRPCVFRSRWCAKGDHVRVKSSNGRSSGHVDGHRRRHDARHPPHRDPASAAVRSVCRCSAGRCVHRRHRRYARSSLWSLSSGRGYPVLWPPLYGNQTWLAFAYRSSFRTKARRSRPFERREIALKLLSIGAGLFGPANRRDTEATRDPCFYSRRHWHHRAWLYDASGAGTYGPTAGSRSRHDLDPHDVTLAGVTGRKRPLSRNSAPRSYDRHRVESRHSNLDPALGSGRAHRSCTRLLRV
jgi:hypothetical protein